MYCIDPDRVEGFDRLLHTHLRLISSQSSVKQHKMEWVVPLKEKPIFIKRVQSH